MDSSIPRITFAGDLTVDSYVDEGKIRLGGSSLNGAMWAKRQGGMVSIVTAVGKDEAGKQFLKQCTRQNIDARRVRRLLGATSSIEISLDPNGEKHFNSWDPGVLRTYRFNKTDFAFMRKHNASILTVYPRTIHLLEAYVNEFATRPARRMLGVVDFGNINTFRNPVKVVEESLSGLDIAVFGLNKDTDERLINTLRQLAQECGKIILITLGVYGSLVYTKDGSVACPSQQTRVIDTTGAGDSFLATFIVALLQTRNIEGSLRAASRIAARVVQKMGAY